MFIDRSLKLGLLKKDDNGRKGVKTYYCSITLIINISIFTLFVVLKTGMQVFQGLQEMWTFSKRCLSLYLSAEGNNYKCLQFMEDVQVFFLESISLVERFWESHDMIFM